MTPPNVRHAFVMSLIETAMKSAGYWESNRMQDGSLLFWPKRPGTETIRICVAKHEANIAADLFALAQERVNEALGEIGKMPGAVAA